MIVKKWLYKFTTSGVDWKAEVSYDTDTCTITPGQDCPPITTDGNYLLVDEATTTEEIKEAKEELDKHFNYYGILAIRIPRKERTYVSEEEAQLYFDFPGIPNTAIKNKC